MLVMIYGIGGEFAEKLVGCAHDATTGLHLLRLLKDTGSRACSLHGDWNGVACAISGEVSIAKAVEMFTKAAADAKAAKLQNC